MAAISSGRNSPRKRRNDPEGLRARILDHAAKLFQERGYQATSVHDLLAVTAVSAGALHHHFPTKKSIALAVLAERIRPAVQETWIDPVRAAPSVAKGVTEAFASIITGIRERGAVSGCPLNNLALEVSLTDAELRGGIESVFAEWRAALVERIAGTRGGARLSGKERTAAADFIISVYSGAMNLAKAMQSPMPLSEAAALLAQWMGQRRFAS